MHYANAELAYLTAHARRARGTERQMLIPPVLRPMEGEARRQYAQDPDTRIIWNDRELTVTVQGRHERSVDLRSRRSRSTAIVGPSVRFATTVPSAPRSRPAPRPNSTSVSPFEDNMAPMVFTDLDDRIIATNDAFCSMIGRTRNELIGFDSKPFTYPDDVVSPIVPLTFPPR